MLTIARLILSGVSKSKIISKYGKKAYDAVKKEIKEMDKVDKLQGNKPSSKFLLGAGVAGAVTTVGLNKINKKKKKSKNPKLKVKKKNK
jgi:hypothetical protein